MDGSLDSISERLFLLSMFWFSSLLFSLGLSMLDWALLRRTMKNAISAARTANTIGIDIQEGREPFLTSPPLSIGRLTSSGFFVGGFRVVRLTVTRFCVFWVVVLFVVGLIGSVGTKNGLLKSVNHKDILEPDFWQIPAVL